MQRLWTKVHQATFKKLPHDDPPQREQIYLQGVRQAI